MLAAARTRAWVFRIACSRAPHYTCVSISKARNTISASFRAPLQKTLHEISASCWTRAPRRQPWLSVRRTYSACSAPVRLWTQSCGCVTLKSCMGSQILRTHSFWSNFLTRPVLFRPSRKVWTKLGSHAIHKQARIVVPQTCYTVSTYCRMVRFEIHRYVYTCPTYVT